MADWVSWREPRRDPEVRLFCFPYAGGAATIFRGWSALFPESIEVVPVELPGHGRRFGEAPIADWGPLVAGLAAGLAPLMDRRFAFFGHSMGGRIAFELACERRRRGATLPVGLFLSASNAPQCPRERPLRRDMSRAELVDELRLIGGTPEEILRSDELLDLFLPAVRADFALVDEYRPAPEDKLAIPFVLFAGLRDREAPPPNVEAWAEHTTEPVVRHTFDAPHIFLGAEQRALAAAIEAALRGWGAAR